MCSRQRFTALPSHHCFTLFIHSFKSLNQDQEKLLWEPYFALVWNEVESYYSLKAQCENRILLKKKNIIIITPFLLYTHIPEARSDKVCPSSDLPLWKHASFSFAGNTPLCTRWGWRQQCTRLQMFTARAGYQLLQSGSQKRYNKNPSEEWIC